VTGSCKHDNVFSVSMKWGISSFDDHILAAGKKTSSTELSEVPRGTFYIRPDYILPVRMTSRPLII
jgi:hypothetical protein